MSNNVGIMKCEGEEVGKVIDGLSRGDTLSRGVNDGIYHHECCTSIYFFAIEFFAGGKYKRNYEPILQIHFLLLLLIVSPSKL